MFLLLRQLAWDALLGSDGEMTLRKSTFAAERLDVRVMEA